MRQRRKPWAMPYLEANPDVIKFNYQEITPLKITDKFELEIGVGKGDFINLKAANNPKKIYYGIEAQPSVLAIAAKKAVANQLPNLKLILGDAKYLGELLPKNKLERIYINFPDPWPKARHEKRRLLAKPMLDVYKKLLTPEGLIIFKSDNQGLYDYSLVSLVENGYIIVDKSEDYQLVKDDFATEYETKFRKLGNPIYRIIAKRG